MRVLRTRGVWGLVRRREMCVVSWCEPTWFGSVLRCGLAERCRSYRQVFTRSESTAMASHHSRSGVLRAALLTCCNVGQRRFVCAVDESRFSEDFRFCYT